MKLAASHPLQLVLGFALWLVWFVLLYGAQAVGCTVAPPAPQQGVFTAFNAVLGVLTLVFFAGFVAATAVAAKAAARQLPDDTDQAPLARFVPPTAAFLYGACAVSTLVVGLPVLFVPPCV